jgi:7,8-dihydroneopterin aldolase/epimerase/oxygenase
VTSDRIFLEDLRFYGHHGVTRDQQSVGAWFSVDAEMAVDLGPAAASDDVRSTVDYGLVATRIVEVCTKERVSLIERLAGMVAHALLGEFPCEEVRVRIRKLTPPMDGLHVTPGVELTRRRGGQRATGQGTGGTSK